MFLAVRTTYGKRDPPSRPGENTVRRTKSHLARAVQEIWLSRICEIAIDINEFLLQAKQAENLLDLLATKRTLEWETHPFPNAVLEWFEAYAYTAIRIQLDRDPRSRSLCNALENMKLNSELLPLLKPHGRKTRFSLREVNRDLTRIRNASENIRQITNKQIVHADTIGYMGPTIWFDDIFLCVRLFRRIAFKYAHLLGAANWKTPTLDRDWWSIFREPWLETRAAPKRRQAPPKKLLKAIAVLEARRLQKLHAKRAAIVEHKKISRN
jgi:hypothetical protein